MHPYFLWTPHQARHYKTLQQLYKTKKPNKAAVTQLMDLEFRSRRLFIDSDAVKEQDRPTKILEAYPCFRELDHVSYCFPCLNNPHILAVPFFIFRFPFCILMYFSGFGWIAENYSTIQFPIHLWDEGKMGKLLLKGAVLWCDEKSHEASKDIGWRYGHRTLISFGFEVAY